MPQVFRSWAVEAGIHCSSGKGRTERKYHSNSTDAEVRKGTRIPSYAGSEHVATISELVCLSPPRLLRYRVLLFRTPLHGPHRGDLNDIPENLGELGASLTRDYPIRALSVNVS
ncbi:hypothetical protein A0H81_12796 [Grifola frondosa]|uniref:Uncharacterized protein n=1 Tax=Grifola frondosa TaxID=5627 RepID=A0A1C7LW51_GRIFR|nr:hypothetical protein A0H81_12796 [Grifola frondosa]